MTIKNPVEWTWAQLGHVAHAMGSAGRSLQHIQDTIHSPAPAVRRIGLDDIKDALKRGIDDFGAYRSDVIFICVFYPVIGLVLVAVLAIAFAVVPLWRIENKKKRALFLAAAALSILVIGGGAYVLVGRPHLAQREATGLKTHEVNGLIPYLIQRVRQYPQDARAWRYLAQAYMEAQDPRDAAKAFAKVIELTGQGDAALDAAYGEALVLANNGAVPPEAEKAFATALAVDPHNAPARFYLGLAKIAHNDRAGALWGSTASAVVKAFSASGGTAPLLASTSASP